MNASTNSGGDSEAACVILSFLRLQRFTAILSRTEYGDVLQSLLPTGRSKSMTEMMLRDDASAHGLGHVIVRYFNVAGADPQMRTGLSTNGATHSIKVAVEAALGMRSHIEVYGTDYPTPDGTCVRDFIHVSDLARAHLAALDYLQKGGKDVTLNCGYGRGYSVREVIDGVRRAVGYEFPVKFVERRLGDIVVSIAAADRIRSALQWIPQSQELDIIVNHALAWERRLSELKVPLQPETQFGAARKPDTEQHSSTPERMAVHLPGQDDWQTFTGTNVANGRRSRP